MNLLTIRFGAKVTMADHCPMDFEGVGPVPGEVGRVVALSRGKGHDVAAVRFKRFTSPWIIPRRFLELVD